MNEEYIRPVIYREDFESGELKGWASYPPCQDTAYNPYVYPGRIRPDDSGISFVAEKEVHWNEDQYLGGVKLLNFLLDRSFSLSFKYYLKTIDTPVSISVHFPLVTGERLVYTLSNPPANRWFGVRLNWSELEKQNRILLDRNRVGITALIIQAHIAKADPDMKVFFAFDNIELSALETVAFSFKDPEVAILDEWRERIPLRHYSLGDDFTIEGNPGFTPDRMTLALTSFTGREDILTTSELSRSENGTWKSEPVTLTEPLFPPGLYRGCVSAYVHDEIVSETFVTVLVRDDSRFVSHPRLLFDNGSIEEIRNRFTGDRFSEVRKVFEQQAASYREKVPPETVVYDFDQFPVKDWIPTLWRWFINRIMNFREALYTNAVVYAMLGDREAGDYVTKVLSALAVFPCWNHPWMEHRGIHSYFPIGEMTEAVSLAYDLTYDLLTDEERSAVRRAMIENYVKPTFLTYVAQNRITVNSSNWISHLNGGAFMALCAVCGDEDGYDDFEPWLTGFILKEYKYIETVFGRDGSYGEGFRYYNFAMHSFSRVIPMLERLFGIDLSAPILRSFRETLWSGIPQDDKLFTYGDSQGYVRGEAQAYWIGGQSGPMNNFAWLVSRTRDPYLSWLYHTLKAYDTFEEVVHDTDDVPRKQPDDLSPVALFRDVGTAVFKSGWGSKDFVFVFRSGPFFNHQHMDQGSFFLADHGTVFLEERYDGDHHYYDDPLYQSHAIRTISHNTVLINGNPQSQEVGDPKDFAAGMNDHAVFGSRLDSESFGFASGRLDGVYRGVVKELWRNVLYMKPRTILIVDRIVPGKEDVDVSLLFHTEWGKDIVVKSGVTEFHRNGPVLFMYHMAPGDAVCEVKNEPHFLCQFDQRPLVERGYLSVNSRTVVTPLVMANLMTATADGSVPSVETHKGNGWVGAKTTAGGIVTTIGVNTAGDTVDCNGYKTDALIVAKNEKTGGVFIADGTYLVENESIHFSSTVQVTAYIEFTDSATYMTYHLGEEADVTLFVRFNPGVVKVNGTEAEDFDHDTSASIVTVHLPAGEGMLEIR